MNEPAMNSDTDIDSENDAENPEEDSPQNEDNPPSIAEQAAEMGHTSKEDWVKNGGKETEWQTPEVFLNLKPVLSRMKEQSRQIKNYAQTIDNLQRESQERDKLYGGQVDNLRAQLNAQRDVAVEEADISKVTSIQAQIDNLPSTGQPANQNVALSAELQAWNADTKNDWYRTDEAKQALADRRFTFYKSQNYTDTDAIRFMEDDINRHFPAVNNSRANAPAVEGGSKPGRKASARKLNLSDLTPTEQSIWRHRPANMWKSEAEFLKAVAKSREDENE